MITHARYDNRKFYYNLIRNFLDQKLSALEFQAQYWSHRDEDLDRNDPRGYTQKYYEKMIKSLKGVYKEFEEHYGNKLYEDAWSSDCLEVLEGYESGARKLDIKGERFFMGIINFIDEYIREYTPSDAEYFDSAEDIDEVQLEEKIRAAYKVLERNKERWV